jgi:hypothetical protein
MSRPFARRAASLGGVAALLVACSLEQIDAISAPPSDGGDATPEEEGIQVEASAETGGTFDGAPLADVGPTGIEGGVDGAAASSAACSGSIAPVQAWTFDTSIEGWILSEDTGVGAQLAWTSSTGYPTAGALEVDFTPPPADSGDGNVMWIHEEMTAGDLTGRTVSAWVWLDSGPSPEFMVFDQTQTDYAWADNGVLTLPSKTWTCVTIPISTPAFSQPMYDTTHVIRIGFQMQGTAPFRMYVDTVRYY